MAWAVLYGKLLSSHRVSVSALICDTTVPMGCCFLSIAPFFRGTLNPTTRATFGTSGISVSELAARPNRLWLPLAQ
ncbi:MAG: hypothetical protein WC159_11755 [Sphaerochaetaceae bacterium]